MDSLKFLKGISILEFHLRTIQTKEVSKLPFFVLIDELLSAGILPNAMVLDIRNLWLIRNKIHSTSAVIPEVPYESSLLLTRVLNDLDLV